MSIAEIVRANDLRVKLQEKLVEKFSACSEVFAVAFFGRHVTGETDQFSDIDLVICSNDLAETQTKYIDILRSIAPIISSYMIVCEEKRLAQMCMFEGYSPYQKVDFSITDNMDNQEMLGPFEYAYLDDKLARVSKTSLSYDGRPRESLENQLNDILFSIPRFTKCLFRGDRNMYRRWAGVTEHMAKILYEKYFDWNSVEVKRLNPNQYKKLYDILTAKDQERLEIVQPVCRPLNISESFLLTVRMIINMYKEKASTTGEAIDVNFAEYIYLFLEKEIGKHQAIES